MEEPGKSSGAGTSEMRWEGWQGPEHRSREENGFTAKRMGLLSRKMHGLLYILKRSVWLSKKGWENTGVETASF